MKVLVTGGTGFVGGTLIPALLKVGHKVVVSVRRPSSSLSNEVEQKILGDLGDATEWEEVLQEVDGVIHLAGLAHVLRESVPTIEEARYHQVNVEATRRLVQSVRRRSLRKFIFLSSLHAVASYSDQPINEETSPHPDSAYARSKLEAERVIREVLQGSTVGWTILRPPLIYGPGQKANMEKLVDLVLKRWPLPFGAVRNRRSLMSVQNISDLVLSCLTEDKADGQTFVCSDGHDLSTPELIEKISLALSLRPCLIPVPELILRGLGGFLGFAKLVNSLYVDDQFLRARLGWKAPWSVEAGLAEMVKGKRKTLENAIN